MHSPIFESRHNLLRGEIFFFSFHPTRLFVLFAKKNYACLTNNGFDFAEKKIRLLEKQLFGFVRKIIGIKQIVELIVEIKDRQKVDYDEKSEIKVNFC